MNSFRSWSRRAWLLHGYLIAVLALLPVPPSYVAMADDEDPPQEPPPEEVWSYDHSESMDSVTLSSMGAAPEGGEVTLQALVETTSWEVWTSNLGHVRTENHVTNPNTSAWVSWSHVSGGGYLASSSYWTDSLGLAGATFVMSSGPAEVRAEVSYQSSMGGETSTATLWLEPAPFPEQTWTLTGNGSSLYSVQLLPLEAGTAGLMPGEQRTLVAEVQESSFDVWTNGNGETEARNTTYAPAVNAPVTFYIQSGDGTLDASSSVTVMTDGQGRAQATFVMGGSTTVAAVVAGDESQGLVEGGSVEFTPGANDETWSFSHAEDSFSLSLEAAGGVTELAAGQEHTLLARAQVTTWQVHTSNYGNTDYREPQTQPLAWVTLSMTQESSGGGWVASDVTTGADGTASVAMGMSTDNMQVRAVLPDGSGGVLAEAVLDLTPAASEWWKVREEGTLVLNLTPDGPQTGLAPGTQRSVSAEVRYLGWEVWSDGATENFRNEFNRAAVGAVLTFAVESGDGTVDTTPVSTDTEGRATVAFTMGSQASQLRGDAWFGGMISTAATLDFSPPEEVWTCDRQEVSLDVQMLHTPGSSTVTAWVSKVTWDVYVLASDPARTWVKNWTSSPAMNAEVGFSISGGSVGSAMVWTDADGYAATSFNTADPAVLTASVSFAGLTGAGSVEVEGSPLTITTETLPPGKVGYDYTAVIQATGGEAPYNFVVVTSPGDVGLPASYNLNSNGVLTGYGDSFTQQAGVYSFTVQVNDSAGRSVEKAFSLTLNALETSSGPFFISTYLPDAMAGWHYTGRLLVGGSGELTFSAQGLPAWLQLSVDGTFSGTPPWDAVGTACQFWVEVQDDTYDPTTGTYRRASAMVSLGVNPHQAAQITVLGGNRQIAACGAPLAQPLAVRISRPDTGAPLAGVAVMFNEFSVTTDADGVARTDWISPLQPGNFSIVVVAGEATATFSAYATHSGTASGVPPLSGTGNNFVPDAPTSQDMTSPHPVDHPLAEYRAVSVTTGKLSVNKSDNYYSWGTGSNGTSSLSLIASSGWHGSRDGVKWRTSDPAHQQESPDDPIPALSELAWSSGLKAKAFNEKVPDGEVREVSEIDFDLTEGGGDATPLAWDYWDGGLFGRTEGVTRYASFEVRIKRAAGDDMQSVLTQSFLEVTTKKDSEGKETSTYTVRELSIEKDKNDSTENTSSPKTLLVTAEEGETKYLLPIDIRDVKGAGTGDDVVIQTASAKIDRPTDAQIAFIEPHGGFADMPMMPQIEASIPGGPATLDVEWTLEVKYDRGNGARTARNQPEDTVNIPYAGFTVTKKANEVWKIYEDPWWENTLTSNGFFGGHAVLKMKIGTTEQRFHFRIGGKNPEPDKAKTHIQTLTDCGPTGSLWFAYAIARSESKDYNGSGSRYNQFLRLPQNPRDNGFPLWGDDGGTRPGGYGMFQVTGNVQDSEVNIPRDQIWNWQTNATAARVIIVDKRRAATNWMTTQTNATHANGTAIPSHTTGNVTFDGTTYTMTHACTIKAYNGASKPSSDTDSATITGFVVDPSYPSIGHYGYWHSGQDKWGLCRFNNLGFNYVLRVCEEVQP